VGVLIHVAPHPDALVSLLCDQLADPPEDPFAGELVAVPTRGIERWLTQQIASGMAERGAGEGICANVSLPSPDSLVRQSLEAVDGLATSVASWEGPALSAGVLDAIDVHRDEPWMDLLSRYLAEGHPSNRLAAAEKMARLFTRYARRRPGMIRAWRAGEDVGPDGGPLPEEHRWQAHLWRAVRDGLGVPALPELLPGSLEPLRTGDVRVELPHEIAVYGLTSTDPLDLDVLVALGGTHDVHLYVLHPSPSLWESAAAGISGPLGLREADATADLTRHPLLAAWGRDSRELQSVLGVAGLDAELLERSAPPPATLLERLQDDIRQNSAPRHDPALADAVETGGDRSVQVHVCHGTRRQAEVLRDALLHLLVARPDLEPRDIVIMTPDLTTFAPLLEAAFPHDDTGGLPDLRLRIADRSPAATNPLVVFTAALLDAADSRLEAAVVRELVGRPVVQNRFAFDADTAGAVVSLIDDAHISWGLDADHREEWGVAETPERTWRRGIDRVMAGMFYADSPVRTVGGISPLDGVEGQDATPAGLLATILDRLIAIRGMLDRRRPRSEWAEVIARSVRMLAAPGWDDEWQLDQLERLLARTFPPPEPGTADPEISLAEARQATSWWTDDRPSPLHFRTGDITVCSLAPMRSVPYRVVALLGMDEARFPRRGRSDGDDLTADHDLVGDRDAGSMDRQLLLDAVLAAGDHLVVTYSGRDELTNAEIPPAVPVAELTDTIEEMAGNAAMTRVLTRHPLQSFSEVNFMAGELGIDGPWGFDPVHHRGALAVHRQAGDEPPAAVEWPPPDEEETIRLQTLIEFLQAPARRFVRARLGFTIPDPGGIPDDTLPADLDQLSRWQVTDRILDGLVSGHDPGDLADRERGSDALPPGELGSDDLAASVEAATILWEAARDLGYDPRRHQPYAGVVDTGVGMVEGTVTADPEQGHLATVTPSRLKGKQRLAAFTRMLFLTALEPDVAWKAILLGKREQGDSHVAVTVGPIKGDTGGRRAQAHGALAELVRLYREGHRHPLPLPCETAYNWQRKGGSNGDSSRRSAAGKFEGAFGEGTDPAHRLVLPQVTSFGALEEAGFVEFCERLWLPILASSREKNL